MMLLIMHQQLFVKKNILKKFSYSLLLNLLLLRTSLKGHILKSLLEKVPKVGPSKENIQDFTKKDDDLLDEGMVDFDCE